MARPLYKHTMFLKLRTTQRGRMSTNNHSHSGTPNHQLTYQDAFNPDDVVFSMLTNT